jgi:hypothetical protein
MTYFKKHFDGENAGESVVELTQELVPVPVYIHRILRTMGLLTMKRPGPVVIKKKMSPCSSRDYEPLLKREGNYVYTKEGTRVPFLNTGVWCIFDEKKQGVGGKCL